MTMKYTKKLAILDLKWGTCFLGELLIEKILPGAEIRTFERLRYYEDRIK